MALNLGIFANGSVNDPPRFIFLQSLANLYARSKLDHRIFACFHRSCMRPNRMPPECMHGHRVRYACTSSGNAKNPCFVVAPYAENNMPTATWPNARDRFVSVDFPAAFKRTFLFLRMTAVTIASCNLSVAGPSSLRVGSKCPRHSAQCFRRLLICAKHLVRLARHDRYLATTSIDHFTSRPGITRIPSLEQNCKYNDHSLRYAIAELFSRLAPMRNNFVPATQHKRKTACHARARALPDTPYALFPFSPLGAIEASRLLDCRSRRAVDVNAMSWLALHWYPSLLFSIGSPMWTCTRDSPRP